jgi:hypothetical protein
MFSPKKPLTIAYWDSMIKTIKSPTYRHHPFVLEVVMSKLVLWANIFLFLCIPSSLPARDFFGGAGPIPVWLDVDYGDLNEYVEDIGVSPFENGLFFVGGGGYLYVHPNVRVGLMGAGANKKRDASWGQLTNEVEFSLWFMGGTAEYVFSFMKGDVAVGTMLGWGHSEIKLRQFFQEPIPWESIWEVYQTEPALPGNFGTSLKGNFFAYQPFLRLKYKLTGWLSLQGSVGYLGAQVGTWKQWGDVDIENEPSLDLGGLTVTLGPHLGF